MPSFTEDLFAIGAGPQVIAVTQADTYPPAVKTLPKVAAVTGVDAERIVQLRADLAIGIPAQRRAAAALPAAGVQTVFLPDDRFEDIFSGISSLGKLSGHAAQARLLNARLRARTAVLTREGRRTRKPRVLVVINTRPIIVAGPSSYISSLLDLAGARNALQNVRPPYPPISAEALIAMQPDAIVSDKQTNVSAVLASEPWRSLRAVRRGRVFVVDPADIIERPGPRYNEGLQWLIERLRTLR